MSDLRSSSKSGRRPDDTETIMTKYKNLSGDSGVFEYEAGSEYIKIRFSGGRKLYVYDYTAPGRSHVEKMKQLAVEGRGLSTYISQMVKKSYSRTE